MIEATQQSPPDANSAPNDVRRSMKDLELTLSENFPSKRRKPFHLSQRKTLSSHSAHKENHFTLLEENPHRHHPQLVIDHPQLARHHPQNTLLHHESKLTTDPHSPLTATHHSPLTTDCRSKLSRPLALIIARCPDRSSTFVVSALTITGHHRRICAHCRRSTKLSLFSLLHLTLVVSVPTIAARLASSFSLLTIVEKARRALRALRAVVRLQAIFRGRLARKQVAVTLRCMQALVRVQARVRARNVRNSPEGKAVQTLLDQYRNQADPIKEAEVL
ncbi:uncharacterized protein LOC110269403 [Arachis ipaensis]|uniref:uncharacterized protein LOC110269403 n=1 Tax=Arachis ipaensis TaxID=130454 RepID=UPI000A2B647C|nr:uncharacterized protein LOC110269403 [Arachis ipaensis]